MYHRHKLSDLILIFGTHQSTVTVFMFKHVFAGKGNSSSRKGIATGVKSLTEDLRFSYE
jgi:hypothetical protein